MSGNSFLLDTNVVLYFLGGDQTLLTVFDQKSLYLSTITELELLSYPHISDREERGILNFLSNVTVVDLNEQIKAKTIELRREYRMKLPDAIIAGTAFYLDLPLFTAERDFERISELNLVLYEIEGS